MIAVGAYGNYPFHFINGVWRATQDKTKWSNAMSWDGNADGTINSDYTKLIYSTARRSTSRTAR